RTALSRRNRLSPRSSRSLFTDCCAPSYAPHTEVCKRLRTELAHIGMESPYAARPWLNHYDYWVRPHMNYPRRPLHEILRITAAEVPDRPATAFLGAHLTFSQVKEQSDKLATALSRLGIAKSDRVGIMLPNCPQYIVAVF